MFGEADAMGIGLEGEDQVTLKYLMIAMSALRSSSKSSYITWLRFFDEGDGSRSSLMPEAFSHTGFRGVCY